MADFLSLRHVTTHDSDVEGVILSTVAGTDQVVVARPSEDSYSVSCEPLSNIVFVDSHTAVVPPIPSLSVEAPPVVDAEVVTGTPHHGGSEPSPEGRLAPVESLSRDTRYRVREDALETVRFLYDLRTNVELAELLDIAVTTLYRITHWSTQPRLNLVVHIMRLLDTSNVWDVIDEGGVIDTLRPEETVSTPSTKGATEVVAEGEEKRPDSTPAPAKSPKKEKVGQIKSEDKLLGRMQRFTIPDQVRF